MNSSPKKSTGALISNWISKNTLIVISILVIGAILRFYKLDWGEGYFFHPDEYHIVAAVDRLAFPYQMNPKLFSYGSFTVYLIYFFKSLLGNFLTNPQILNSFLIGRLLSACFSTASILIVYKIARLLFKEKHFALLATFFTAIIPGLIQQAHFATPESTLTFWILLTCLFMLTFINLRQDKYIYMAAITQGLAASTKVTAFVLLPLFTLLLLKYYGKIGQLTNFIKYNLKIGLLVFSTFIVFFPYSIIDFTRFKESINYEGSVAVGKMLVFYTRQFINTLPVIFQIEKIFPYVLGPVVLVFAVIGFLLILVKFLAHGFLSNKKSALLWLIFTLFFVFYFLPNSLLFAKWTRFMSPILPFMIIYCVYFIKFMESQEKIKVLSQIITALSIVTTCIWSIMVFSLYTRADVRLEATRWIIKNIPQGTMLLTETGNTLEVPLTKNYMKIPFDFYNLEASPQLKSQLVYYLSSADYFIIQSRRIYLNHRSLNYPTISRFYVELFNGRLGFEKIAEFKSFPKLEIAKPQVNRNYTISLSSVNIWQYEIPDINAEETWSVFDHPVISIYKKTVRLEAYEYEKILQIQAN